MLLIITNKHDISSDIVIDKLYKSKIPFFRWNLEDFLISQKIELNMTNGKNDKLLLYAEDRKIDLQKEISMIWYRRPGELKSSNEITDSADKNFTIREGSTLLSNVWQILLNKDWVNHPFLMRIAEIKLYQLHLAASLGLSVPYTVVTNNPKEVLKIKTKCRDIIAKSLSAGYLKEGLIMYSHKLTENDLSEYLESVKYAPVLFQEYIPKKIELRITVIKNDVFSCAIESQKSKKTEHDWRRYDFDNVPHYQYKLPSEIENKLIEFLKMTNLKFGAFDMILTPSNEYVFLEVNPNGQWYWVEKLTGLKITDRLVKLFKQYMRHKGGERNEGSFLFSDLC